MQNELLTLLDFDLMALTPQHVLNQLLANGVIVSCDQKQSEKDISERTLVKVKEYAQFLCDVVAEQYTIVGKYPPSKVAVACFYLARRCCHLRKYWSQDMEEYTTYSLDSLLDIIADMNSCHDIRVLVQFALNNFKESP